MIINQPGVRFEYEGRIYTIGEPIIGTFESEYEGLFGFITEIRDGADKETENDTPDIYCDFSPPTLPHEIKRLEAVFSDLYDYPKTLNDICLDTVIMAPSMVEPMSRTNDSTHNLPIFVVQEDWSVKGECGNSTQFFTDYRDAQYKFHEMLKNETHSGIVSDWSGRGKFQTETGKGFFECWISDEYFENHYKISINEEMLKISDRTLGQLGRQYVDERYRKDVIDQAANWDAYNSLTEEQRREFVRMPDIPERIHKALGRNDSYWETVSEISREALQEYQANRSNRKGEE